jgi:autotransporter family porin
MAGYGSESSDSRSDRTGYKSEGSVSGYSAGLYATWYENNETRQGMYFDSWAQYGWFDNDVKGSDIDKESYKSSGVTTSMELGYAHKLGEFTDSQGYQDEWFVEPQAQAIWMGVEADDHRESNGTRVSGEGDGNLQTRLGVRTFLKRHSKSKSGEDLTIQPYVDVNWIHNSEDFGVRMDNTSAYQNGARNIAEIKPGIEGQLTPSLSLRGNVGLQVGENGYDNKSATVGLDYTF